MNWVFELILIVLYRKDAGTMAVVYATLILKGKKTLEQVPDKIRKDVKEILEVLEIEPQKLM